MALVHAEPGEVVEVALADLCYGPLVRRERVDIDHVERLTLVLDDCPPIVVQAETGAVLDGFHRWNAATRLGRSVIRAVIVECVDAEALELAVKANLAHGLPLTLAERKSVARQLAETTDWSDRRIGDSCGISHDTVASTRPRPTGGNRQLDTPPAPTAPAKRKGKDDRDRPVDEAAQREQREKIAALITSKPNLSDREIALRTKSSPTTVGKVRAALAAGESPIPHKLSAVPDAEPTTDVSVGEAVNFFPNKGQWVKHPASKATNASREFARWMDANYPSDKVDVGDIIAACPAALQAGAIDAAKCAAEFWSQIAKALGSRGLTAVEAK